MWIAKRKFTLYEMLAALALLTPVAAKDKAAAPLILAHADYNENSMYNGKLVSVLKGNVHFAYDDAEIFSREATWYRGDGVAKFIDSVRIERPTQTLRCNRLDFNRDGKTVVVTGDVDFFDKKENVRMLSQRGIYHLDTKAVELDRDPVLMRFDSTAHDTLRIVGKRMFYDDSLKVARVVDDVRILKGKLNSNCQVAYYYPERDIARLRNKPHILYDRHTLDGDSVDLHFKDDLLRGISVVGKAKGIHNDYSADDSVITNIEGDSLFMALTPEGHLDTTWVYRNVKSRYFSKKNPDQVNEARGKVMTLLFTQAGAADKLIMQGNAESTYYVDDESGAGRNEASGDRIDLYFRGGRATYILLTGAVRGIYFAQRTR
jgi:hypothetical protein